MLSGLIIFFVCFCERDGIFLITGSALKSLQWQSLDQCADVCTGYFHMLISTIELSLMNMKWVDVGWVSSHLFCFYFLFYSCLALLCLLLLNYCFTPCLCPTSPTLPSTAQTFCLGVSKDEEKNSKQHFWGFKNCCHFMDKKYANAGNIVWASWLLKFGARKGQ